MNYLYHYYEKIWGPFVNLSNLSIGDAQEILNMIKNEDKVFAAHRYDGYLERRTELEKQAREMFIAKGGNPILQSPHYMVVEACPWLETWYIEGEYLKIPITEFEMNTVSYTYGDMFPTFSPSVCDGKEYRNKLYNYEEIMQIIQKYGLPQHWNAKGQYEPERYIEAQVWSMNQ